jgi:hypothetical protein
VNLIVKDLIPSSLGAQEISSFVAPLPRFVRTKMRLHAWLRPSRFERQFESITGSFLWKSRRNRKAGAMPVTLLCNGMKSCTTLKHLGIRFGTGSSRAIEEAFRSSSASLKGLRVVAGDLYLATAVLKGLKVSNCLLQELHLFGTAFGQMYSAARTDFAHTTTSLTHLKVGWHEFDEETMDIFLRCLENQSSIVKLSFVEWTLDSEEMCALKRFMGKYKEGDTLGVSALDEFVFLKRWGNDDNMVPLSGSTFASMFWMGRTNLEHVEGQSQPNNEECPFSTIG